MRELIEEARALLEVAAKPIKSKMGGMHRFGLFSKKEYTGDTVYDIYVRPYQGSKKLGPWQPVDRDNPDHFYKLDDAMRRFEQYTAKSNSKSK